MEYDEEVDAGEEGGIVRAKSAYMYFQTMNASAIKEELIKEGADTGFGAMGSAISARWKALSDSDKEIYLSLAREDKERYNAECAQRDEEVLRLQEQRRRENNAVEQDTRMRKATLQSTETLIAKESAKPRRTREYTDEQIHEREERKASKKAEEDAIRDQQAANKESRSQQAEARLKFLLSQSDIFSHFGSVKDGNKVMSKSQSMTSIDAETGEKKKKTHRNKRSSNDEDLDDDEKAIRDEMGDSDDEESGGGKGSKRNVGNTILLKQPSCIIGAMRPYQLEGLNWMIRLTENGVNGILADEMGLGKTLQSISVIGYMHEYLNVNGPHLVMVPKSTLSNWMNEFKRWCPVIRAIKFHGTGDERSDFIRDVIQPGRMHEERGWDVIVTTPEVLNIEKNSLSKIAWKYLIVDEAHRLKNEDSQIAKTVRMLDTQHRLLLTGTPLQNNLHELWALLNFLLPDVFASAEQFDDWFNLNVDDTEAKQRIIGQLHKILRPFMLRRLKADVEKSLPPKTETILFTGLTATQRDLYKNILKRDIDVINSTSGSRTAILNIVMQLRKCCNHPYLFPNVEDRSLDPLGSHLYESCGKMLLLAKLLAKMKERGHRVLIFSQMTKMLDILEDFLISQGYLYCRIDGNTTYDEREDRISDYNAPNSSKFIFLLSTRAGGLGINLQTADTVIIYDSDWNPQADLQAQDRAHRIGQKKPVQVFRLVTDETVEVKVVERAQQKLKLDAMVVQQGRLQEKEKKLSKDELLDSIRFGADKIFRAAKDAEVTDADIDLILEEGKKRTEEMNEKLQAAEKGDLYDFSLDGGMTTQVFEGVDYSTAAAKAARDAEKKELEAIAGFQFIDPGKRERKIVASYAEQNMRPGNVGADGEQKIRVPRYLRLPKMEDWNFYNKERLVELHDTEIKLFEEALEKEKAETNGGTVGVYSNKVGFLPPHLLEEKNKLLSEGFGDWTKVHFNAFTKACAKYGRSEYEKLAKEIGKPADDVRRYSETFWKLGEKHINEFERHVKNIEKGEKRLEEIQRLTSATKKLIMMFDDPWEELTFRNIGTQGRIFNAVEDRFLLCLTHVHGYGAWDLVRSSIRRCERFRFDFYLQSCSAETLGKRCENLMKAAERELIEIERKKNVVDSTSGSGRGKSASDLNKEKVAQLTKQISEEAKKLSAARAALSKQAKPAEGGKTGGGKAGPKGKGNSKNESETVAETSAASPEQGEKKERKKRAAPATMDADGEKKGLLKPVPEAAVTSLCNLLVEHATLGVAKIVAKFLEDHPDVSKRQTELKIAEMADKEKRGDSGKIMWHIKPEFLKYVTVEYNPELDEENGGEERKRKTPATTSSADGSSAKKPATGKGIAGHGANNKRKTVELSGDGKSGAAKKAKIEGGNESKEPKKYKRAFAFFVKSKRLVAEQKVKDLGVDSSSADFNDTLKAVLKEMYENLDESEREIYTKKEEEDKARYDKEMVIFNASKESFGAASSGAAN